MAQSDEARTADLAVQIGQMELLRIVIAELCYASDTKEFRRRVEAIERTAVDGVLGRRLFPQANDATENQIKEQAALYITRIMTSIRHPQDPSGDKS